jgi:hypothetical protein
VSRSKTRTGNQASRSLVSEGDADAPQEAKWLRLTKIVGSVAAVILSIITIIVIVVNLTRYSTELENRITALEKRVQSMYCTSIGHTYDYGALQCGPPTSVTPASASSGNVPSSSGPQKP